MDYAGSKEMLFEVFISQEKNELRRKRSRPRHKQHCETLADEFIRNYDALLSQIKIQDKSICTNHAPNHARGDFFEASKAIFADQ